jgi:hypothetical protein
MTTLKNNKLSRMASESMAIGCGLWLALAFAFTSSAAVICDGDPVAGTVIASKSTLAEAGMGTAQFIFRLAGPVGNDTRLTLQISGTASNGVDYQTLPTLATIPAGQTNAALTVTPIPDTVTEGTETITVLITASGNACVYVGSPNTATISIVEIVTTSLDTALDDSNLVWTTGGSASWTGQTSVAHDGVDAAQSGMVTHNQESWLHTTVSGPGTLTFWWKVSSELDFDWLRFHVDGVLQEQVSGEVGWQQRSYRLPEGLHTLKWRYVKDPQDTAGQDCGWVDQVSFTPVSGAPAIVVQPANQTAWEGANLALSVVAFGSPPLIHEWSFNDTNPLGLATNATLTLSNLLPASAGSYRAVVRNGSGVVTSSVARVSLANNTPASSALLFVDASTASAYEQALQTVGITYQRYTDFTAFSAAVSSANRSSTLVVIDAPNAMYDFSSILAFVNGGGRILIEAYGLAGQSSLCAALKVSIERRLSTPQPLYAWGGSPFFVGLTSPLALVTTGLYSENGQSLHALAGAQGVAGYVEDTTPGEAALVIGNSGHTIVNGFFLENATSFAEAVRLAVNEVLFLTGPVSATTPLIKVQPGSQSVMVGTDATFSVLAWGGLPLGYQWVFNGDPIGGATTSTLTVPAAQAGNAGDYRVIVDNTYGWATSMVAVLTVTTTPVIHSTLLYVDGPLASPYQAALNNLGRTYQLFTDEFAFNLAVATANPDTTLVVVDWSWNYFTSTELATYVNAGGRAVFQCWHNSVAPNLAAAFKVAVGSSLGAALPVYDWGGSVLFAGVGSPFSIVDTLTYDGLKLLPQPGGSAVGGYTSVVTPGEAALVIGDSGRTIVHGFLLEEALFSDQAARFAQDEIQLLAPREPAITNQPQDQLVAAGSTASFSVSVSGDPPLTYQWFFNETTLLTGATETILNIPNAAPSHLGTYQVVVSNPWGTVTSRAASLQIMYPPVFTQHPQSQTVAAGSDVAFTVSASGTLPMSYRWRRAGATLTNLTLHENTCTWGLTNVQASMAGGYTVVVTNLAGRASGGSQAGLSSNAYLTVVLPPTNQAVIAGSNAVFAVSAVGLPPIRYQWQFNGTNLVGATNTSLTLTHVQAPDAGGYAVVVTAVTNVPIAPATFSATLTVVSPGPTIGPCALLGNGHFQIQFSGSTGQRYAVLVSTNLVDWEATGVATETAPGQFEFEHADAALHGNCFYRLRSP